MDPTIVKTSIALAGTFPTRLAVAHVGVDLSFERHLIGGEAYSGCQASIGSLEPVLGQAIEIFAVSHKVS